VAKQFFTSQKNFFFVLFSAVGDTLNPTMKTGQEQLAEKPNFLIFYVSFQKNGDG